MTCFEFQDILPDMIDGEAKGEHAEHLKSCAECSDLVSDLRAIAEGAKLLAGADEPSPRVWANIQRTLETEGLIRSPLQPGGVLIPSRRHWTRWAWVGSIAAVLALSAGLLIQKHDRTVQNSVVNVSGNPRVASPATTEDVDDQELLADMSPNTRTLYEENLKNVNASIQDAQATLAQDPENEEAQHFLQQAYQQKAMVYELAMDRSMQ
jgi:hypothetical protein